MSKLKAGVIGATGMVGRRFVQLLKDHPWFEISALAASPRSAGLTYADALLQKGIAAVPTAAAGMPLLCAHDAARIAERCDFVFCAVSLPAHETAALEYALARCECPVVSNNSANRLVPDVPMVIPEVNPRHIDVIPAQRRRLGTKNGFIAVKSNCSVQSYLPLLFPLHNIFGLRRAFISTYQAVSGAGRTLDNYPEIIDNVIPYISGEEAKSEIEPLKLLGAVSDDEIIPAEGIEFHAKCFRVPVSDGHTASVFAEFERNIDRQTILEAWHAAGGLALPSAPSQFIRYFDEPNRPQPALDRNADGGMAISVGQLRATGKASVSFTGLSHNTMRGAAGGAVLLAELLVSQEFIQQRI